MPESTTTIGHSVAPASRADVRPIPVIGLIGGIGGGKSAAAAELAARGAEVIDADAVGHETLRRPEIVRLVAERFGPGAVAADGSVDRRGLGRIVFADPACRRDLEAIVHPPMFEEFERRIAEARGAGIASLIVLDAAILLESGWDRACDAVVFVDAPREQRLDRVRRHRGWSDEDLRRREAAQWSLDHKKAGADFVVPNDGDRQSLGAEIDRVFPRLTAAATDGRAGRRPGP